MKDMGCQGIYIDENAPNIMMLYFADDIVDGADTVGRLQYMINALENYCDKLGMHVNLTKTKIIVFRRGEILKKYEKLEVVSFYKYLGLMFTSKLKWTLSKKTIALQAEKAFNLLYMHNSKCGSLSVNIMLDLFDKIVLPILLYGSQIWGTDWSDVIENVHISFCKRILRVHSSTPNAAVLGIYPLAVHYHTTCLKYWLKLLKMPNNRYLKACYLMLKNLDDRNRFTLVTSVRYM